jgi:nicotinamidase-related amidase
MIAIPKDQTVHLCVDMQRMFAEETQWHTPWVQKILPQVIALTEFNPENTIFTRFIPAEKPGQGQGMWKKYYEQWDSMTLETLDRALIDLTPELSKFVPPAAVIDKHVYGPWLETDLYKRLNSRGVHTLIVSGGEIDVCVLATVLGAVDIGYRVIIASDAVCSSDDSTYDAAMSFFRKRFSVQIEVENTDAILHSAHSGFTINK